MKSERYWQLFGNACLALNSFVLAFLLLQYAPTEQYGIFTFVLVLQAFGMALLNALVASPLLLQMNTSADSIQQQVASVKGFLLIAIGVATIFSLLQAVYLWLATADFILSTTMALASWLQLLRWYGRCEWQNRQVSVLIRSDLRFSAVVMVCTLGFWHLDSVTLQSVTWALLLASVIGLQPFISGLLTTAFATTNWQAVKKGFGRQGKPALFGVLTVEATANFHSYLVIGLSGGLAFAPLAAAMMFFRPLAVVLGSLQQSDRPMLVKAFASQNFTRVYQLKSSMRIGAVGAFILNILLVFLVWYLAPNWLWPEISTRAEFIMSLSLWCVIALLRALRLPITTLLQAADQFLPLARITYVSAFVTVPAVTFSWWLGGAVASLSGVLAGELILGLLVLRLQKKLLVKPVDGFSSL